MLRVPRPRSAHRANPGSATRPTSAQHRQAGTGTPPSSAAGRPTSGTRTSHRHASSRRTVTLPVPLTDWILETARGVLAASPTLPALGILSRPRGLDPRSRTPRDPARHSHNPRDPAPHSHNPRDPAPHSRTPRDPAPHSHNPRASELPPRNLDPAEFGPGDLTADVLPPRDLAAPDREAATRRLWSRPPGLRNARTAPGIYGRPAPAVQPDPGVRRKSPDRPARPRVHGVPPAPAARRLPPEPQQALQLLLSGLGALIVTSIVVLTGFFVIAEERRSPSDSSSAPPGTAGGARVAGQAFTGQDIFPAAEVQPGPNGRPYRISLTHVDTECALGTTGELGGMLRESGCNQVVRAAMVAPYADYSVTAGVLDLPDAKAAARFSDDAGLLVESGRGGFAPLGGAQGGPAAAAPAQSGWQAVGHYLVYCVISRPDGNLVTDDDPHAARITKDLVENYLTDRIAELSMTR
ncbi:hypothetical protein [Actinoplanes sp. NPDC051859]|uniref:hypothetical protein n=1 Tax=Actinoplanes sp. NPDC051859 TaxID=3363909 RepID=UPI0037AF7A8D